MTKEQLQAENERLGREVAALRDLLTAISEGDHPFAADGADLDSYFHVGSDRMHAVVATVETVMEHTGDAFTGSLHSMAGYLRKEWAKPLRYEPETAESDEPASVTA
jgi:hypothetical protein